MTYLSLKPDHIGRGLADAVEPSTTVPSAEASVLSNLWRYVKFSFRTASKVWGSSDVLIRGRVISVEAYCPPTRGSSYEPCRV
jgi:hypothetical protein